jgi:chemotaxis protein methyltransferase CheR
LVTDSYEEFKKKVFQLTKIDLNAYKEQQMRRRIDALIERNKMNTYAAFVDKIRTDHELYDEFVSYLTINVSEFYRNPDQWKILENEILPDIFKKTKRPKIWSAACSTGDEPYSLVMLLSKFIPLSNIKITATDIDKRILAQAKSGLYNEKFLKGLPPEFKTKYFTNIGDGTLQLSDEIKRCVDFKQHDLLKDPYPAALDLIVCRNVVIYFTEDAKEEIYKKFNQSLVKDGVLFVGNTEQIIKPRQLGFEPFKTFFYRKMEAGI